MSIKLFISLSGIFATGVCLAQAPVVDSQSGRRTPPPIEAVSVPIEGELNIFDLEARLKTMERVVNSRTESQQQMQSRVDVLQSDIDEMRGSIELHNHQLEKLLERQRELFLELDRRFASMQNSTNEFSQNLNSSGTQTSRTNNSSSNTSSNTSTSTASGSEAQAYQAAVNLILKDKDYANAVPAFQSFLSQYPNSDLTANAHYWLGQLLYNQQNFVSAKEQFEQVATKFSSSPKRADSLLKLGLIEKAAGNSSAADLLFQQVVNEYPNGTAARLAQQQLAN